MKTPLEIFIDESEKRFKIILETVPAWNYSTQEEMKTKKQIKKKWDKIVKETLASLKKK